ncbi:MAG: site-specific integrase [Methanocellales archaeon]|nr:site-specific integrase [Methanocellales archaeon]
MARKGHRIDIYDWDRRLDKYVEKVRTTKAISEKNKKAILDFQDYCFAKGLEKPRILKYLRHLFKLAEWLGKDFEDADEKDLKNLVMQIEKMNFADWTKHDYRVAIKYFYRWLRGMEDEYPKEVKWIKTGMRNHNNKLPEEILTEEEIKRLIEASEHPRDRALVFVLYEAGCRVGELCSLRIKNVSFDDHGAQIIVNGKTGMRRIRIIAATPHLADWMGIHPFRDDPEAPLWLGLGTTNKNMPLNYASVRKLLQVLGKRAGIKKSVNPHALRHSRATFLANHLTEAQMNQFFGWVQGSNMASTYVHLSGRDTDKAIAKIYGMEEEHSKKEESALTPKKCSRCMTLNAGTAKFCNRCGAVLDLKTAITLQDRAEGLEETVKRDEIMNLLLQHEEMQKTIAKILAKLPEEELKEIAQAKKMEV